MASLSATTQLFFYHELKCTGSLPLEKSIVLIISLLMSLLVDQVSSLQDRHITAGNCWYTL